MIPELIPRGEVPLWDHVCSFFSLAAVRAPVRAPAVDARALLFVLLFGFAMFCFVLFCVFVLNCLASPCFVALFCFVLFSFCFVLFV